jgi:hypothetical protein
VPATCVSPGCARRLRDSGQQLLIPRYGYSTAAWDPPTWSGNAERVGEASISTISFLSQATGTRVIQNFGGVAGLTLSLREGGELLASNGGAHDCGFAVCTRCGYADSERKRADGRMHLPPGFESHFELQRDEHVVCWSDDVTPVLRNHHLGATYATDILEFNLTSVSHPGLDTAVLTTIGHALRLAGAELLELDHRELGGVCTIVGAAARPGLYLFDNTAGGSGHVVELMGGGRTWLERALETMYRNEQHHCQCATACLVCLLTNSSQTHLESGLLQRRRAYGVLKDLLDDKSFPAAGQSSSNAAVPVAAADRARRFRERRSRH